MENKENLYKNLFGYTYNSGKLINPCVYKEPKVYHPDYRAIWYLIKKED